METFGNDDDNDNNIYIFPIKVIKKILKDESDNYFSTIMDNCFNDRANHLRYIENNLIDSLESYDQIDEYISDIHHIGLQEWIDSL
jgi:hypothetical protein